MTLIKHSKMLRVDDLTIAALSYLVSGWLFEICPCPLEQLQVRGAERNFGPRGKNFVWAFWSAVPQNHVMSKKGHSVRRCSNFGAKSSDEQKKGYSLRKCSNFGSTSGDEQIKVIASAAVILNFEV